MGRLAAFSRSDWQIRFPLLRRVAALTTTSSGAKPSARRANAFAATGNQFNNETFFPQGRSEGGMICVIALYEQKCGVIHDL